MIRFRHVPSRWKKTLLVCRKCGKRIGGGYGPKGRTPLAKALRKASGLRKGRKADVGIVEVGCLGVCPKGGVTVVNAAAPGDWLVVPAGAPVDEVVARLLAPEAPSSSIGLA